MNFELFETSKKGSALKGKNFLPWVYCKREFFPIKVDSFSEREQILYILE